MVWSFADDACVNQLFGTDVYGINTFNERGLEFMKAFFEEYGLVLVVTIIATGMILFSNEFKGILRDTLTSSWENMTEMVE